MGNKASIFCQYSRQYFGDTLVHGNPIGPCLSHISLQIPLASNHMLAMVKPSSIIPSSSSRNQKATFLPLATCAGPLHPLPVLNSSCRLLSSSRRCLNQWVIWGCFLWSSWTVSAIAAEGVEGEALDTSVWYAFLYGGDMWLVV